MIAIIGGNAPEKAQEKKPGFALRIQVKKAPPRVIGGPQSEESTEQDEEGPGDSKLIAGEEVMAALLSPRRDAQRVTDALEQFVNLCLNEWNNKQGQSEESDSEEAEPFGMKGQ